MKRVYIALCGAMLGCTIASDAGETNRTQYADHRTAIFSVTNDVAQVREYRLYERRKQNNDWNDGNPFDQAKAGVTLAAMEGSRLWDHKSHAVAYSAWDTQSPAITIGLAWSADVKDKAKSVWICYGNRLFWWNDSLYQLPEGKGEVLDQQFPKNR